MLEPVLNQIAQDQEIDQIVYYLQNRDRYEALRVTKYSSKYQALDLDQVKIDRAVSIDLQQRQFKVSSIWFGFFKLWRWIIALLAILLVVTGYNKALALYEMDTELARIKANQYQLIKRYLPSNIDESANLKKALIAVLKQYQASQQDINFLGLLSAFTQAKVKYPTITVNRISYQKGRLSIDVKTDRLSEIEALNQAIESAGQVVKLENLDIKPEATSGRFVLMGNSG